MDNFAKNNTIFQAIAGSELYGTSLDDTGDRDEMGICIEPPEYVIGLREFEQYKFRTQPEGVRSGPGDLDLVIYSLRKWTRLAAKGNPTILQLLFIPDDKVLKTSEPWQSSLTSLREHIVARSTAKQFLGYMKGQRAGLMQLGKGTHTNRPELIAEHGYDTKFAGHLIRLGIQGVELMNTGFISQPLREEDRSVVVNIRRGKWDKTDVIAYADELEWTLESMMNGRLATQVEMRETPDLAWIDNWLIDTYLDYWKEFNYV